MTLAPNRRWFRFSLRTMLVLVALLSVLFGWKINRARNQRAVVDQLAHDSCKISYAHEAPLLGGPRFWAWLKSQPRSVDPPGPQWARTLVGGDFFLVATGVVVRNNLTEELAGRLAQLPALREIALRTGDSPPFVSPDVRKLVPLKRLESISIEADTFEACNLANLAQIGALNSLSLAGTPRATLSSRDARSISQLPRIQYLALYRIDMHDDALASLSASESIEYLTLVDTPVHASAIIDGDGFKGLRTLHFVDAGLSKGDVNRIRNKFPMAIVVGD